MSDAPPLDGVRVVEVADGIAAAVCGMMLADAGAHVVRLHGGAASEPVGSAAWNRGKECLNPSLDLAEASKRLADMLADADVCIVDGGRDWSIGAFGLDRIVARDQFEHVVFVHLTPFLDDAPWAGGRASHPLLCAAAGLTWGQAVRMGSDRPVDLAIPHAFYAQGLLAAGAAVAALVERRPHGRGQIVTVDGLSGALVLSTSLGEIVPVDPISTDVNSVRFGNASSPSTVLPDPFLGRYCAKDGVWVTLIAPTPVEKRVILAELDLEHPLADQRLNGDISRERVIANDVQPWLSKQLARACVNREAGELAMALARSGCPAAPALDRATWFRHPQVMALAARVSLTDPVHGEVCVPAPPYDLARTCLPRVRPRRFTDLWQWPRRSVGTTPGPVRKGPPLAGVRVLSFGQYVAGPLTAMLLAELGADVVKIESLDGDPVRERSPHIFNVNRGARSVAIDLRDDGARRCVDQLIRGCDVLIHNFRPGVMARLGIDLARAHAEHQRLISVALSGFGEQGPLGGCPAYDRALTAYSGIQRAQGGDDAPVELAAFVLDSAAGLTMLFATCAALLARERDGIGQHATTTLVDSSLLMQLGEIVESAKCDIDRVGAEDPRGGPLDRYYRSADGWMRVAAAEHAAATGYVALGQLPTADVTSATAPDTDLAGFLASLSSADGTAVLQAVGMPATVARRAVDLVRDDSCRSAGVFARRVDGAGTESYSVRRHVRFSRTTTRAILVAPGLGEHTLEVLTEAGVAGAVVNDLIARGVAAVR
jgi:crotonobetainyl-CoA:carnitine CoA-transferase CaiB-like acyl-CoA transferase